MDLYFESDKSPTKKQVVAYLEKESWYEERESHPFKDCLIVTQGIPSNKRWPKLSNRVMASVEI